MLRPLPAAWAERIAARDRGAIARAISAIENETADAPSLRAALAGRLGHARILGVTGPPGAGKSTLVNALIGAFLARGRTVAVLAVDPSSPVSGGAVLGDRLRMREHDADERVYIRSAAARGHLGGLTRTARAIVDVLDAARFDVVIVETVGAGQSEVEIAGIAETSVVVCPADFGDDVQAIKAGVLEIAHIFVVNKSDMPFAGRAEQALLGMLELGRRAAWTPPVVRTVATTGEGVPRLLAEIERHQASLGPRAARGAEETADGPGERPRYLKLRADTLMGMFRRLPQPVRAAALAALADSTYEHGGDSARRYPKSGSATLEALLETIERTAAELGWGEWRFGARDAARLALEVTGSPFAQGHGPSSDAVCAPIAGMLRAVAELTLGGPCDARETACSACGAPACRFEAILRSKP